VLAHTATSGLADELLLNNRLPEPAGQQPEWDDPTLVRQVREELATRPGLVDIADVHTLSSQLGVVAAGEAGLVQAGDCAENPAECGPVDIARKTGLLDLLAGAMKTTTGRPVLRAGRMAGQLSKPRSHPTEQVGPVELTVFRGHMINGPEATPESRRPDPTRILAGYLTSAAVLRHLGWSDRRRPRIDPPVWTSHEALLLDYEVPMLRRAADGSLYLSSTHWPWIGERSRQVDGAHVALLSRVVNPVACKVGPDMTAEELLALCDRLDPGRRPGRLTLIARMGAEKVADRLPRLVAAVQDAGHPVIWLSDPMHGNTVTTPDGFKTRLLPTIRDEVTRFQDAVRDGGGVAGGLHLETTPDEVTECVATPSEFGQVGRNYTSLCDPRLNLGQAASVVAAWRG
jgi:3-deoxy-7-phosphoheptulonate synthase